LRSSKAASIQAKRNKEAKLDRCRYLSLRKPRRNYIKKNLLSAIFMYEAQITVEVGNNEKHISVVFFHSFSFLLIKNTSSSLQHQHSFSSRAEKIEIMQTSINFLSAAFSIERKQRKKL
jgi:hypothetical protein